MNLMLKNSVVKENVPMSEHTTFKTGGNADIFVWANCHEDILTAVEHFKENNVPYMIIGKGSNLLVSDKGIRGAVIKLGEGLEEIALNGNEIYADAGASMSAVSNFAMENSLAGFEFASGIPGSFGGGIFMNAGAYDGEIKDVLKSVKVIDKNGNIIDLDSSQLDLSYRKSNVEEKGYIVLGGTICLKNGDKEEIKAKMADFNGRRRDKQPLNFPSAGSTFKRPEGNFAGKLIEDCGLKGFSIGGAEVSKKHAGFIVNKGNATSNDILELINYCIEKVFDETGVKLEPEVRIIGEK